MKRMIFATIALLMTAGVVQAGWFGRGCNNGCARRSVCEPVCAQTCEPAIPKCCKTIKVPVTVMEDRVIEVPARKIVTPVPDVIEYVPQAATEIRTPQPPIPQPDIITYRCNPDKIVRHPQPPCVRYECTPDCQQS